VVALLAALVLLGDNWLSLRIPWQDFGTGMHAISKMLPGDALDLRPMLILSLALYGVDNDTCRAMLRTMFGIESL